MTHHTNEQTDRQRTWMRVRRNSYRMGGEVKHTKGYISIKILV